MMNGFPVILSMNVVTPDTIGTLYNGFYDGSYGYTSAVLDVICSTLKLEPRQHVSAFLSSSLREMFLGYVFSIS